MRFAQHLRFALSILVCFCFSSVPFATAQTETATISGRIADASGAVVAGVSVDLLNVQQGTILKTKTNKVGIYVFASVNAGQYSITARKQGFKQVDLVGVVANVQDHIEQNFRLDIGSVSESVTVSATANNINTTDASVGTVIDRQFVENIPMNGRSFQTLVLLSPGTVTQNPNGADQGEYSVNGNRSDSNGFTVDGASASNSPSNDSLAGSSGMLPSATILGTTQAMLQLDAMEEFRIVTSTYSAEFGNHPGAQVSFRSRSGTNMYHGVLYDYLRNSFFDSNNWFNTYSTTPVPTPAERQNDFGGTLGGPLSIPGLYSGKDRAFFFLSYEGLRLNTPQASSIYYVPTNGTHITANYSANPQWANLRKNAPAALTSFLNAWPLPNCDISLDPQCVDYGDGGSPYIASPPQTGKIDSISGRFDYQLNSSLRLFGRYADTTSNTVSVYNNGPSTFGVSGRTRTYLLGADGTFGVNISNELRLQYSPAKYLTTASPIPVGGAGPYDTYSAQGIQPSGETVIRLYLPNAASLYQEYYGSLQNQPNTTDTLIWTHGRHLFKFGATYVQTTSIYQLGDASRSPNVNIHFDGPAQVMSNKTSNYTVTLFSRQDPTVKQFGIFAQDEWHILPRLSLSLGLRWELAPPPSLSGAQLYTYTGDIQSPASLGLSKLGAPMYKTTWNDFAPRFGAALVIHNQPGHELVLRAGGGLFYESISLNNTFGNGTQLGSQRALNFKGKAYPVASSQIQVPILPPTAPYTFSNYPANNIVPPDVIQWNVSLERALGTKQTFTLGYVASVGRKLETLKEYNVSTLNPQFTNFALFENGPDSNYNSLQMKYQRQMSHGLQALASYTWAHSIDWSSSETSVFPLQRGNSDHDVRNNFSAAAVYNLPSSYVNAFERAILGRWTANLWFIARSAFPYEPQGAQIVDPVTGDEISGELNYNGKYPYVHKAGIPGGRQIDPTIFSVTTTPLGTGTAPRNFLRAFGEAQANVAIQRDFPLYERATLQFRGEAFNITNHPNFGKVNLTCGVTSAGSTCNNTLMGQATSTLNSGLGTLNSLYQQGGPRSLQFALKLQF